MGGIEPPSIAVIPCLLRAYLAEIVLLGSETCRKRLNRRAQSQFKSRGALKHNTAASSLIDARHRDGNAPGLTDFMALA